MQPRVPVAMASSNVASSTSFKRGVRSPFTTPWLPETPTGPHDRNRNWLEMLAAWGSSGEPLAIQPYLSLRVSTLYQSNSSSALPRGTGRS